MRTIFFSGLCCLVLASAPAAAFDYIEHAHFTWRALERLIRDEPAWRDVVMDTAWALDSELACKGPGLLAEAPEFCFALADVPALSGDHAGSPVALLRRWFDDSAKKHPQAIRVPEILAASGAWSESPDDTDTRVPDRSRFLTYIRRLAPRFWPVVRPDDLHLLGLDDAYLSVLLRMRTHFRPPMKAPSAELASQRETRDGLLGDDDDSLDSTNHRPRDQAFAWYADLHLGALTYATMAAQAAEPAGREYRATALFLELSALHYLQDSVAPGHITTNSALGAASTSLTHDRDNAEGLLVDVPDGLCALVGDTFLRGSPLCAEPDAIAPLEDAGEHRKPAPCPNPDAITDPAFGCKTPSSTGIAYSETRRVVLYGDGVVASEGRVYAVPAEAARAVDDWASALSYLSLREVLCSARTHKGCPTVTPAALAWPLAADPLSGVTLDLAKHPKARQMALVGAWWDTRADPLSARRERIREAFDGFQGLANVPVLSERRGRDYVPLERLAGHTISMRVAVLHAFDEVHSAFDDGWGDIIPEVRLAYRIIAPRLPVVLEASVDSVVARGDHGVGVGTHAWLDAGVQLAGGFYAHAGIGMGVMWPQADFSGRWQVEIGANLEDHADDGLAVAWIIGGGDELGFVMGLGLRGSLRIDID